MEKSREKEFYKAISKMTRKTKIGLIQLKISNNKNFNLKNSIKKIREAKKKGAKIICVPELFLSNYFCKTENQLVRIY